MKYTLILVLFWAVTLIGCEDRSHNDPGIPTDGFQMDTESDSIGDSSAETSTQADEDGPDTGKLTDTGDTPDTTEVEEDSGNFDTDSSDVEESTEGGDNDTEEQDADTGLAGGDLEPSLEDPSMVIDATNETVFLPIRSEMPVFVNAVAVHSKSNVFVGGNTWGNLYGTNRSYGMNDAVCAKFSSNGKFLKGIQFGTRAMDIVNGVLSDRDGNIYLTGRTAGEMETHFGMEDFFVTKLNAQGEREWTGQFGTTDPGSSFSIYEDIAYASTIDAQGAVYLAGITDSMGSADGMIVKFSRSGGYVWDKILDVDALSTDIWGITVTSNNKIFVTGMVGYSGTSGINYDLFVAGIHGSSQKQFFYREWGTEDISDYGKAIVADSDNNIYVVGQVNGELVLIVIRADNTQKAFKKYTLGATWIEPRAVALDEKEDIYIGGSMSGNQHNQGMSDLFVMKIHNDDTFGIQWQVTGGTDRDDMVNGIDIGQDNTVYAAGSYKWDLFDSKNLSSNGFLLLIQP